MSTQSSRKLHIYLIMSFLKIESIGKTLVEICSFIGSYSKLALVGALLKYDIIMLQKIVPHLIFLSLIMVYYF